MLKIYIDVASRYSGNGARSTHALSSIPKVATTTCENVNKGGFIGVNNCRVFIEDVVNENKVG